MGAKCHCCACQSVLGVWSLFCVWCAMGWTKLKNGDGLILRREAVGTPELFASVIRLVEFKGKWDRAEFPLLMNCRTCAGQLNVCCHFQKKDIYTWRCLPMSVYFQFSTCVSRSWIVFMASVQLQLLPYQKHNHEQGAAFFSILKPEHCRKQQ